MKYNRPIHVKCVFIFLSFKCLLQLTNYNKRKQASAKMVPRKSPQQNGGENQPQAKIRKVNMNHDMEEPKPPIFNLVDDCCYAILEWLSCNDLCSFGQTCKWAQRVAVEFYAMNYSANTIDFSNDFDAFDLGNARQLKIVGRSLEPYRRIKIFCQQSVKHICVEMTTITPARIDCLKNFLSSVEHLTIKHCEITGDFYQKFLKFCTNLKTFRLQSKNSQENPSPNGNLVLIGKDNKWLTRKYPTLESLEITPGIAQEVTELKTFFNQNPNVRNFSIKTKQDRQNWDLFQGNKINLDILAIQFYEGDLGDIHNHLNNLHERGVFKRLHWYSSEPTEQLATLKEIERLTVRYWSEHTCTNISPFLIGIRELCIRYSSPGLKMEATARNIMNLERLYLFDPTCEQILSFIRHSAKLVVLKVGSRFGQDINLLSWNKEREKLSGARKVIIYVPENVYLATKWATKKIEYDLVKLKRENSYNWDPTYYDD